MKVYGAAGRAPASNSACGSPSLQTSHARYGESQPYASTVRPKAPLNRQAKTAASEARSPGPSPQRYVPLFLKPPSLHRHSFDAHLLEGIDYFRELVFGNFHHGVLGLDIDIAEGLTRNSRFTSQRTEDILG